MIAKTDYTKIVSLLETLPPESLMLVEQFVRFLQAQAQKGTPVVSIPTPYLYPTVTMSSVTLHEWAGLLPEGYEGDALEDSEALYDKD